jgi:hypothetical protein
MGVSVGAGGVQYAGNVDAMAKWLRVTSLGYLAPEGLVEAATRSSGPAHGEGWGAGGTAPEVRQRCRLRSG